MPRFYGFVGLLLIALAQINFSLKIEPFASWYFPIIWFGYIFFVDSLVYHVKGRSLLVNNRLKFFLLLLLSAFVWWVFEFFNIFVQNWHYHNIPEPTVVSFSIAFATVIPAVFETAELIVSLTKSHKRPQPARRITSSWAYGIIFAGVACMFLALLFPLYFYWLIWISLLLVLDPINYLQKRDSILQRLRTKNYTLFTSLFTAGIICGFLWEFWNFSAVPRWTYTLPFLDFYRVFEMPIIGYLGYLSFALELFAIYHFTIGRKFKSILSD